METLQKPLSEEEFKEIKEIINDHKIAARFTTAKMMERMATELNRLQSIEASHNLYKRALRQIVCLNIPIPDEVFNLANDALEGADSQ